MKLLITLILLAFPALAQQSPCQNPSGDRPGTMVSASIFYVCIGGAWVPISTGQSADAKKLQGVAVCADTPSDTNVLGYSASRGCWVASAAGAQYVGLVATRTDAPTSFYASNVWWMQRSFHVARKTIPATGLKLVWANWYVDQSTGAETAAPGSSTYKASIEYPAGTITPCTFAGASTVTVSGAVEAITDSCGPAIPNGAVFWVRALYTNPSGDIFSNGPAGHWSTTNDAAMFGSGAATDRVNSGTITASNGQFAMVPVAIIGNTSSPAVCLIGDSRTVGGVDAMNDATGDTGQIARAIGPVFAYTKLAAASTTTVNTLSSVTNRIRIISTYCSHVIDALGINDVGATTAAATIAANRASLAALFGKPTFGTTLPAITSSTDAWATTTNQTTTANTSAFNALVRAGIAGEVNYFDIAAVVDPGGLNKWPVSRIAGATTGTAGFATSDGIHESSVMNQVIAQSGIINIRWFMLQNGGPITYYVDPAGSDIANGQTPALAIASIGRVNSLILSPGDSVLFRKGSTWTGAGVIVSSSGLPGKPITYSAYGTGVYIAGVSTANPPNIGAR